MPKQDTTNDKSGSMGSTGQLSQNSNKGKQILLKNASSSQIHNQVRPNYGNPHANVRKANGQSAKRKASKAGQHALNMFSKSNVAGQASNGSIITIGSMDSLAIQGNQPASHQRAHHQTHSVERSTSQNSRGAGGDYLKDQTRYRSSNQNNKARDFNLKGQKHSKKQSRFNL